MSRHVASTFWTTHGAVRHMIAMNFTALTKLFAKPAESDSSAALLKALASIDVPALEAKVLGLEAQRRTALLSASDAEIAALDDEIRTANIAADRAVAAREELDRRIEAARQREAAAALDGKRQHAEQLTAAAIAAIEKALPAAFAEIHSVLRAVAEAEAACEAVNEFLPAGQQVAGPEAWRNQAAQTGERIVSEKIVTTWAFAMSGQPLDDASAKRVVSRGNGVGHLPPPGPISRAIPAPPSVEVHQRRFRRIERVPAQFGDALPPLASAIALPPIRARENASWEPTARFITGEDLLRALDETEAQLALRWPDPPVEVVLVPVPMPAVEEAA